MREKNKSHLTLNQGQSHPSDVRLKKGVGAIHSSGKLTLVQRKLANVLLYAAYDNLLSKRTHTIPVSIMCSMLGWEESNRIDYLKEALSALQETRLEFNLREEGHEVWESMTMLSYAKIKNGVCTWRYDEALAEKLYDPAMFAMINLQVQRRIDSAYALNLYENAIRFKNANKGSTGLWDLGFFREIVGATASYCDDFRLLNRKVIKPAMEKINEVSDIMITVEHEKRARSVVGLTFYVREKTESEKDAMQNTLPGMSLDESVDAFADVRTTEAFKALRKHGIPERLAFTWIKERGEKGVLDMVAYTEKQDAKTKIKSTSGYMAKLVKEGAEFNESEYDKQKKAAAEVRTKLIQTEAQKKILDDLRVEYKSEQNKVARNALSIEERTAYAQEWLQSEAGQGKETDFNSATGKFKTPANNIAFEFTFLPQKITKPFSKKSFIVWLKESKKLDPVKLGLEG